MPARLGPWLVALAVSVLVFAGVALEPFFVGDISLARGVQALSPGTGWAIWMNSLALPPAKYVVMGLAVGLAFGLAGWRGAALAVAAITIEQIGGEASKQIAQRPRPSPELIGVVGRPSGFSFPSTSTTFIAVTFGTLLVLAWRARPPIGRPVAILAAIVIVLGWAGRVTLGAHWPSDVVLTTVVCLVWIWAARRALLPA